MIGFREALLVLTVAAGASLGALAADKTAEKPAEEVKQPYSVAGKVFDGKRLQPRVELVFAPDVDPTVPGEKKRGSKKRTAISTAYENLQSQYKKYIESKRDYDEVVGKMEDEKRELTRKSKSNESDSSQSLSSQLREVTNAYKSRINTAKQEAEDEAAAFRSLFQTMVNIVRTYGQAASATSDGGGAYKVTLTQTGTYYLIVPEPFTSGSKVGFYVRKETFMGETPDLTIDIARMTFEIDKTFWK